MLKALDEVSAKHQTTPAAIAMAWVYSRPAITAPIASATKISHLQALFAASKVKLDQRIWRS
ncbi:MAG: aldo/keto reductase [Bacteroidia bacterium]